MFSFQHLQSKFLTGKAEKDSKEVKPTIPLQFSNREEDCILFLSLIPPAWPVLSDIVRGWQ